jgi:hypothetical protein
MISDVVTLIGQKRRFPSASELRKAGIVPEDFITVIMPFLYSKVRNSLERAEQPFYGS